MALSSRHFRPFRHRMGSPARVRWQEHWKWEAQRLRAQMDRPVYQLRHRRASRLDHRLQHRWQYGVNRPERVVSIGDQVGNTNSNAYADAFCGKTQETGLLCVVEGQALEASEYDGIYMSCKRC